MRMRQAGRTEQTMRFGVFDVDLRSGELRKAGARIKLQEQPFKVLTTLLMRPGEVVAREELRNRIWPHESFGDFDHAVNIAVAKVRTALGDSAEAPRFIETLYGRGYRFVFPVDTVVSQAVVAAVDGRSRGGGEQTEGEFHRESSFGPAKVAGAVRPTNRSRWIWFAAVSTLLLAT